MQVLLKMGGSRFKFTLVNMLQSSISRCYSQPGSFRQLEQCTETHAKLQLARLQLPSHQPQILNPTLAKLCDQKPSGT